MTAGLTKAQDQIPVKDKEINAVGVMKTLSKDYNSAGMSKENRTVSAIGSMVAIGRDYNAAGMAAKYRTVSAIGNILSVSKDYNAAGMSAKNRTITSIANVASWQNNISNSVNGKGRPYIGAQANVTAWQNNISNSVSGKGRPLVGALANVTKWQNNISNSVSGTGRPLIGSMASINKYLIDKGIADGGNMRINATANVTRITGATPHISANGGAFFGGAWHDIPQYAGGTTRAGSLFIAGEAGPEIVGHIGGRTEVLNQSQLAATMYSAVRSAMSGIAFHVFAAAPSSYDESDGSGDDDALYRAFRRALDETDFGGDIELDGQTLYRAMVNRNRQNTRVTGVNALA